MTTRDAGPPTLPAARAGGGGPGFRYAPDAGLLAVRAALRAAGLSPLVRATFSGGRALVTVLSASADLREIHRIVVGVGAEPEPIVRLSRSAMTVLEEGIARSAAEACARLALRRQAAGPGAYARIVGPLVRGAYELASADGSSFEVWVGHRRVARGLRTVGEVAAAVAEMEACGPSGAETVSASRGAPPTASAAGGPAGRPSEGEAATATTYTEAQYSTDGGFAMIRSWLAGTSRRDVDHCARYMARTLRIGTLPECRALVRRAIARGGAR